jgi:acyl dehydratase
VAVEPPAGKAPDFEMTEATAPEQALLYRLSGDLNPLHASPEIAKLAGFDRPILHGLCTYGHAGRAVLRHACGGDPARFRAFAARFSGVVFPGDSLTTRGWQIEPGKLAVRVDTQDGRTVLSHGVAEVGAA